MILLSLVSLLSAWLQLHWPAGTLLSAGAGSLAAGMAVALLAFGRRRGAVGFVVLILVGIRLAGGLSDALEHRLPTASTGQDLRLSGTLCEFPRHDAGFSRFLVTVDQERSGGSAALRQVLVTWYRPTVRPAIGDRWEFTVRLKPPRGTLNAGAFDFESWALGRHIDATGYVREVPAARRLPGDAVPCIWAPWRGRIAAAITAAVGERPALAYLLGLTVGAYQSLPPSEWEQLRRTGTVHLISISGFHLALVALPFFAVGTWAGQRLLRYDRSRASGIHPRTLGALTALLAGVCYAGLAGNSVPTLRSVIMMLVVALAFWSRGDFRSRHLLALCVVLVLWVEPLGVLLPGFWLSFGGVALLLAGAGLLSPEAGQGSRLRRLVRAVPEFLRLQAVLAVGLLPIQLAYFGQAPLAGGFANLIAIPVFSLALLPLSLAGAALTFIVPPAGVVVLHGAADLLDVWRSVNGRFAELPAAVLESSTFTSGTWVLAVAGVIWLFMPRPWPWRWLALPALVPLLAGQENPLGPGEWVVTVLDVGHGTAVLVQTRQHALLFDTGPGDGTEGGGGRLLESLAGAGVRRLDALVVSHGDQDHAGAARAVLARHPEALFYSSGFEAPGRPFEECRSGVRWQWDRYEFAFLHPARAVRDPGNEDSCVLSVSGPGGRLLLTGDLGRAGESELVARGRIVPVDLMVVGHHGSKTSSDPDFVKAVEARHAVFSTAYANRWGFPVTDILRRWRDAGACVHSTAAEGALRFVGGPDKTLSLARSERVDDRRPWRPGARVALSCGRRAP